MAKTYTPQTRHYRDLLAACRAELISLGYGAAATRLNGAGELLGWLERRGKGRIDTVERADLEAFVAYLQLRPNPRGGALSTYTVRAYLYAAGLVFNYAERHGLRGGSPLVGLQRPAPPAEVRYVASRREIAQLYATAAGDSRLTAILHLLYGCGLRRTEVERLNVDDVDYGAALLYVRRGKGRKRRVVPLTATVAAGLRDYQRRHRWRWVGEGRPCVAFLLDDRGGRLRGSTLGKRLGRLVERAEVDGRITPHVLRHSVATHLLGGGMALERIRDFLGHCRLETTQVYAHVKGVDA